MGYRLEYIYFYPYYLTIAFLSYFIGFSAYYRVQSLVLLPMDISLKNKALLSAEELASKVEQLQIIMNTEQLHLNRQLRLQDLAHKMDMSVQNLSYILNTGLQQSFHDFINQKRVETVQAKLAQGELQHKNLLGIAQESGFNSESSFYRIFKQFTGTTPKRYLQHISQKNTPK